MRLSKRASLYDDLVNGKDTSGYTDINKDKDLKLIINYIVLQADMNDFISITSRLNNGSKTWLLERLIYNGELGKVKELFDIGIDGKELPLKIKKRVIKDTIFGLGDMNVLRLLIANGFYFDDVHYEDDDALHWASENGHVKVVKLLLDNGANGSILNKGNLISDLKQIIDMPHIAERYYNIIKDSFNMKYLSKRAMEVFVNNL